MAHRDREGGDATVCGHVVVRAGEEEAPLGLVGVTGPDLLARDDIVVPVAVGSRAQGGQVRARVGLAEALAPAVTTADDAGKEALCDLVAGMLEDPLHEVAQAGPWWGPGGGQLLVDDDLEDARPTVSTDLDGPGHAEEPGVVERAVPVGHPGPVVVVGRGRRESGIVVQQPGSEPESEFGLLRGVTEVHRCPIFCGG
jgi:hypothetical protein